MLQFDTLSDNYAYATEVQMATLEHMEMRKSTAASALRRQAHIVETMIGTCTRFKVTSIRGFPCRTPRLRDRLKTLAV